jgi:ubiquinone/menaquinone biosynthesis C-methylase UbiE
VTFRDHFSRQAALYSIYRPEYPPELFKYITGLAPGRTRAWDCATGNGQAAVALADYFDEVIATDASPEQISHVTPHKKVTYSIAAAEASGLSANSVDLVTVAQALHWFDFDDFYREVNRVLVSGGGIAVWGYGDPVMDDPELERFVHAFNRGTIEAYWPPNRNILLDRYQTVAFPFREVHTPEFRLEKRWTLAQLAGYFRTWSATNRYIAEKGTDPVAAVEADLAKHWGGIERERLITWPLYLRAGVKLG